MHVSWCAACVAGFSSVLALTMPLARAGELEGRLDALRQMSFDQLLDVTIITASKHEERPSDTPAQVIVVTREQIRERRYRNLADVLQDLPGVDVYRGTKSSTYNNPIVQGLESNNKFLILQDGVRIDHPAGGKLPVADNFPLFHVKQVEIVYGPSAALYGADAFAGVINLITDAARDVEGLRVAGQVGSDDRHNYTQALLGLHFTDNVSLNLGGHVHDSAGADLARYYPEAFAKTDAVNFAGEIVVPAAEREDYLGPVRSRSGFARLDIGKNFTLAWQSSFFRSLTSTGDRPDTALYRADGQWNTAIDTTYAQYRFDAGDTLSGKLLLDYATYEVSPDSKYVNIFTNFQDNGYDYAKARRTEIEQQFTWLLNGDNTLIAGLVYAQYQAREMPGMPFPYNPDLTPAEQGLFYDYTDVPIAALQADFSNSAGYLQWQARWNEQWSSSLGLRYDKNSRYSASLNPRLGVVYRHTPATVFKLLYGEGFRAPSPEESFSTFGSFTGERNEQGEYIGYYFRAPNSNLEPEKLRSLSLVWDWRARDTLNINLNAYYYRVENIIFSRDEDQPTQFLPGAELRKTSVVDNLGEEHHYGADLSVTWRYRLGPNWQGEVWGNYSYIRGKIREDAGDPEWDLPYITPHKIKLGSTLRYQDKYFITPKLYLIDNSNSKRADKNNFPRRLQAPEYAVMDLHFGARNVLKNLSAFIDIYNLFDNRYYAAYGSGSTTFVSVPQAPRSFLFSLEYRF